MNSPTVPGDGTDQSFSAKVIRAVFSNIGAKLGLVTLPGSMSLWCSIFLVAC